MDEKAAIEKAVRDRLALLHWLEQVDKGNKLILTLCGWRYDFKELHPDNQRQIVSTRKFMYEKIRHGATFPLLSAECAALERSHSTYLTTKAFATDIIPPVGMVHFEEPITDPQDGDLRTPVQAIAWAVCKIADLPPMGYKPKEADAYALMIFGFMPDTMLGALKDRPRLIPNVSVVWQLDVEGGGVVHADPARNARVTDNRAKYVKLLLTFFALLRQDYFEKQEPREVHKDVKNRLRHARKTHKALNTGIQVIRFRPRTGSGNKVSAKTGTGKKLTKSTWTMPHWKWQWYAKTEENKPILVDSFVRGPDKTTDRGIEKIFRPAKPLGPKPEKGQ